METTPAPTSAPTLHLTGLDLKIRRIAAGVSQVAVARAAGVHRQRITFLEGHRQPTTSSVRQYLSALEQAESER